MKKLKFDKKITDTRFKEYQDETHYICKKDKKQKQLEVAIRELRKQLPEEEEKRTEVEAKYKNL